MINSLKYKTCWIFYFKLHSFIKKSSRRCTYSESLLQLSQPTNGHSVIILSHLEGTAEPGDRGCLMGLRREKGFMVAVFIQWIVWFWHKHHTGLTLPSEEDLKCLYLSHSCQNEREPPPPPSTYTTTTTPLEGEYGVKMSSG